MTYLTKIICCFLLICASQRANSKPIGSPTKITSAYRGGSVQCDATIPMLLPSPENLTSIISIDITKGSQICTVAEIQPAIMTQNVFKISQNELFISNNGWNAEIMATSFDAQKGIIYVIMDNGTMFAVPFLENISQPTNYKTYSYEQIGAVETWLVDKIQLHSVNSELYSIEKQELRKVHLHQQGFWIRDINVLKKSVISSRQYNNNLYVLTTNELYVLLSDQFNLICGGGVKFIDFQIIGLYYFIIDQKKGLLTGSIMTSDEVTFYTLPQTEDIRKISGYENTILITYQINRKNYIAEYFISNKELSLNRYYHNYYLIKDIHMTKNYAVIDAYNEFIIFHHSINKYSFTSLQPVEFIYKSHGEKVISIHLLDHDEDLSFIIGYKQRIQQLTVATRPSKFKYAINSLFVRCKSDQKLQKQLQVAYKGICTSKDFPSQNYYCEEKVSSVIAFQYNHEKRIKQKKHRRFYFIIIFATIAIFTVLFLCVLKRKLEALRQRLKEEYEKIKSRRQQHSQNMQKTFNADIPK